MRALAAAWLFILLPGVVAAQNFFPPAVAGAEEQAIRRFIEEERERQQIPGLAVGMLRGGKPLLASGFGLANVELTVPATARTVFQSGSLGKQFTAVLLMMLVEEGRLGLEDPIASHFPGSPAWWQTVTVRHLLTHTSGVPDYTEGTIDLRRDYSEDELLAMAQQLAPAFPVGTRWQYSNTGYLLLGILVHRVTGRFYGDLLGERIFGPLGMANAQVISEAAIVPHRAAGYRLVDGELRNQEWVSPSLNTTADGALYFSVTDLLAWQGALRSRALLQPASWAQVLSPVRLADGREEPYGFGWVLHAANGAPLYHHSGSWQGFKSYAARFEAADLDIVVLANLAEADPSRFVDGIARLIDPALSLPPEEAP
ncbi:MAG: serine hydrolase domain-containing protein [Gammaproteobacteria bacterium]